MRNPYTSLTESEESGHYKIDVICGIYIIIRYRCKLCDLVRNRFLGINECRESVDYPSAGHLDGAKFNYLVLNGRKSGGLNIIDHIICLEQRKVCITRHNPVKIIDKICLNTVKDLEEILSVGIRVSGLLTSVLLAFLAAPEIIPYMSRIGESLNDSVIRDCYGFVSPLERTLYDILADAYAYDDRNQQIWDENWKETDDFFYDNPEIADKYSLVTCLDGEPIGFVTWDPRHRPDYVEIIP